ncbi:MAG: DMT family transporter [Anaerolineae bacterium]
MPVFNTLPIAMPRTASRRIQAYLALVSGVVCISFSAIFTKLAGTPGAVTGFYRMAVTTTVLLLPFWLQQRRNPARNRRSWGWAIAGGLWFSINLVMLSSALTLTSAANATLLDNTAPIWVGLGALFIFRERLNGRYWLGLALALAGAAVVTGVNPLAGLRPAPGDALAFVGAIFYAGYLLNTQRGRRNLDTLTYLWLVAATATVVIFLAVQVMGLPLTGYSTRTYLALLGVGLIPQTAGWLLINYALGHLPASAAVVVLLAQPVTTGLLSIPLLREALTRQQVVGGALALMGIYLCVRRQAADESG